MRDRKDVLDIVRKRINELREEYLNESDEDSKKLAGKRPGSDLEGLEEDIRSGEEAAKEEHEEGNSGSEGLEGEEVDDLNDLEDLEDEDINKEELEEIFQQSSGEEEEKEEDEEESKGISEALRKPSNLSKERTAKAKPEESSESDEESDNQGFVKPEDINTFKKPKKERIKEALSKQIKEKYGRKIKKKVGSTTNTEKLKSKPFMMVQPKKTKDILHTKYKSIKERIRDLQKKKGKVRAGKIKVRRKIYVKS